MKKRGSIFVSEIVFAILMAIIFLSFSSFSFTGFLDVGKIKQADAETATLSGLIAQYKLEIGSYPSTLNDLKEKKGQYGPWINEIPKDPWTNQNYSYSFNSNKFIVYSTGPDKSSSSSIEGISGDDIGHVGQ